MLPHLASYLTPSTEAFKALFHSRNHLEHEHDDADHVKASLLGESLPPENSRVIFEGNKPFGPQNYPVLISIIDHIYCHCIEVVASCRHHEYEAPRLYFNSKILSSKISIQDITEHAENCKESHIKLHKAYHWDELLYYSEANFIVQYIINRLHLDAVVLDGNCQISDFKIKLVASKGDLIDPTIELIDSQYPEKPIDCTPYPFLRRRNLLKREESKSTSRLTTGDRPHTAVETQMMKTTHEPPSHQSRLSGDLPPIAVTSPLQSVDGHDPVPSGGERRKSHAGRRRSVDENRLSEALAAAAPDLPSLPPADPHAHEHELLDARLAALSKTIMNSDHLHQSDSGTVRIRPPPSPAHHLPMAHPLAPQQSQQQQPGSSSVPVLTSLPAIAGSSSNTNSSDNRSRPPHPYLRQLSQPFQTAESLRELEAEELVDPHEEEQAEDNRQHLEHMHLSSSPLSPSPLADEISAGEEIASQGSSSPVPEPSDTSSPSPSKRLLKRLPSNKKIVVRSKTGHRIRMKVTRDRNELSSHNLLATSGENELSAHRFQPPAFHRQPSSVSSSHLNTEN
jgi:hypothetical protein